MPLCLRGIRLITFAVTCVALTRAQSTTITASPNPSVFGQPVTITATVPSNATGKVTFYDGLSILGVSTVTSGQAVLVTRSIGSGNRLLTAYYSGDANNPAALSTPNPQAVTPSPANGL